ncbi:hypothetical protein [Aliikangiella coralliicola]|uniref:CHASE3 domain-containing protein n=1 Tax=Aliikangiella coralliicola TaxID=2592383 RepID=A0A545UDS8_9GAMM|nr:hypothetical protein [Aliikangiella coralliicola]TQV87621.1 hypothetical protein FLL46_12180 [Aliikangiella coralliicola]
MHLKAKLKIYYFTAIFSVFFAIAGFSYNTWRMEVTEDNNNIRTAAFEVIIVLAELEQVIYAAHYDQNESEGNPRVGWVKVGLASDLSALVGPEIENSMKKVTAEWSDASPYLTDRDTNVKPLIDSITEVRMKIKHVLKTLD